VVKALECGQKGCGFKSYLEHIKKKSLSLGIQRLVTLVDAICQ